MSFFGKILGAWFGNAATAPAPVAPNAPVAPVANKPASRAKSAGPTIALINHSTVISNPDLGEAIAALQIQIDRDFAPLWNMPANLVYLDKAAPVPAGWWQLLLLDDSDQQGALGYHDDDANHVPVGRVFAKTDKQDGLSWTVTLSHELLEMLADPYVNNTVFMQQTATTGMLFAFEMCDAVEDDSFGYRINGVLVSDFVTPAYFEPGGHPVGTKYDFQGRLTYPLSLGHNGYMSVFAVNPTTTGWTQATGAEGPGKRLAAKLGRSDSRPNRRANS